MSYAVMRIARHKSCQSLATAERHGRERHRIRYLEKPERTKENLIYKKYKDLSLVESWKEETKGLTVRKNAVYMLELVLSFSPEAQSQIEPRLNEWLNANMNWVSNEFGKGNILQARSDFDERTLHMHVFVVPLVDNRLNARKLVGNRARLSELQSSYAEAVKQFGLERGQCYTDTKKEKPRHKDFKRYHYEEEMRRIREEKEKTI